LKLDFFNKNKIKQLESQLTDYSEQIKLLDLRIQRKSIYDAALVNRLTSDWITTNYDANTSIKTDLTTLRARSRNLAANNDYIRRFLQLLEANVIGDSGILLQMKIKEDATGGLDKRANQLIEQQWKVWTRKGNTTVCTQLSWVDVQKLVLRTTARDGECIIRMHKPWPNKNQFALQLLEADHLVVTHNATLSNGNTIVMGIEYDKYTRPVAYHITKNHPGAYGGNIHTQEVERVPARQIIHLYTRDRIGQSRGIPWLISSMLRMKHLHGFEEAEVVASRASAGKMGFITSPSGTEYQGQGTDGVHLNMDITPGAFEQLPAGTTIQSYDPQHPNTAFRDFVKSMLRGVSAGLGISYNSLANDLESVNYSSLRQGALEERDMYKSIQGWFLDNFITPIFESWLEAQILGAVIPLPFIKFEKFNSPVWYPRRWSWIDPGKDITASVEAINNNLKSRQAVCAEQGIDFQDLVQQLKTEQDLIDKYLKPKVEKPKATPVEEEPVNEE
jgi:lambda family phage portal protein